MLLIADNVTGEGKVQYVFCAAARCLNLGEINVRVCAVWLGAASAKLLPCV
jgi:hypothetical protein